MGRILAIDYGEKRVGVAITDPLGYTAQGLPTIEINGSDKKFFKAIEALVKEKEITEIVIGYPKHMNGDISDKARKIDTFIPRLETLVKVVAKWDERLTTAASYGVMRELGIKQTQKNIYADKLAATYILEGYMSKKKNI
ncbi:MAG: Holliday junction resolvase RuvX [Clostridia bacterium]